MLRGPYTETSARGLIFRPPTETAPPSVEEDEPTEGMAGVRPSDDFVDDLPPGRARDQLRVKIKLTPRVRPSAPEKNLRKAEKLHIKKWGSLDPSLQINPPEIVAGAAVADSREEGELRSGATEEIADEEDIIIDNRDGGESEPADVEGDNAEGGSEAGDGSGSQLEDEPVDYFGDDWGVDRANDHSNDDSLANYYDNDAGIGGVGDLDDAAMAALEAQLYDNVGVQPSSEPLVFVSQAVAAPTVGLPTDVHPCLPVHADNAEESVPGVEMRKGNVDPSSVLPSSCSLQVNCPVELEVVDTSRSAAVEAGPNIPRAQGKKCDCGSAFYFSSSIPS